ncbi:hypothetical protein [Kineosporia sp. NBRC 101731]|uniref:hypothetical protein n=1 Tax=Kineosporia sp. NBRC 101731 TaxID=3032199 RepID=UPI0024A24946|nr:hypothetical protein [Kineosporia sp. NBRC 101731]GLY32621.1 hypothetical protein Kisp02_59860 [Kineosporia sp. NBRC 101731]
MTAEREAWLNALSRLYPVPAGYRVPLLDEDEAQDVLRCGPDIFADLVAAGLPHDGGRFDRNDLTNLALDAGTGQSRPERAVRYALRWMREDPRTWETPMRWSFSIEMSVPDDAAGRWSHTRFLPELNGGLLENWESSAAVRMTPTHFEFDGPGPVTFSGSISTAGKVQGLVSPALRKITEEFLDRGYRWVRLPEDCQHDYAPILDAGVAPCVAASTYLQKEFQAAGYEARTRGGWILGMLDLAHSWVEVVDDDGVTKPVDAVFERLSALAEHPHPGIPAACVGSRINRMLPGAIGAGAPESLHHTAGGARPATTRTVIRRVGAR